MDEKMLNHNRETLKHVNEVRGNIQLVIKELDERAQVHDASKFVEPEASIYAAHLEDMVKTQYGTPEYQAMLDKVRPALDNHYAKNRHHPQHWPNGIEDMDLCDIMEMFCDWIAATKRLKNGNVHNSIKVNAERFKINPQLVKIFENTANRLF
jgi:hypothetical protein